MRLSSDGLEYLVYDLKKIDEKIQLDLSGI